jgi:two-component system, NtrC family, response regulator
MANILIIDDDRMIRNALVIQLTQLKHTVMVAETLADGLAMLPLAPFDIVFLDVHLPDGNGLEAMPAMRQAASRPEVIIITGEGSAQGAELAIRTGAWDYIQKPLSTQEIELQLTRALDYRSSKMDDPKPALMTLKRPKIIGSSPELNSRLDLVAQCARSGANALITGETGTGKELFARLIHDNGFSPGSSFVVVDCAALPEQLVESVLFGNVKGAFTGADGPRDGLVKEADGGTLFLDEIGELPLSIQKKFLRVLQERCFKPVGGTREVKSDFRLISATNRNLEEMVAGGRFRKDLLFRLKTVYIELPPLRLCKQDIRALVLHYIDHLCRHYSLENKGFVPEFMETLVTYDWPGNVRELINTLEKAILTGREAPTLFPQHLPRDVRLSYIQSALDQKRMESPHGSTGPPSTKGENPTITVSLTDPLPPLKQLRDQVTEQVEGIYMQHLMSLARNDLDLVGRLSGLSKPRIYALLKKYNIPRS